VKLIISSTKRVVVIWLISPVSFQRCEGRVPNIPWAELPLERGMWAFYPWRHEPFERARVSDPRRCSTRRAQRAGCKGDRWSAATFSSTYEPRPRPLTEIPVHSRTRGHFAESSHATGIGHNCGRLRHLRFICVAFPRRIVPGSRTRRQQSLPWDASCSLLTFRVDRLLYLKTFQAWAESAFAGLPSAGSLV
jgi:hypothetical protein